MHRRGLLARRILSGSASRSFAFVLAGSLASGCLVSFDGYQLENGGGANVAGTQPSGGKVSGGAASTGGKAGSNGGAGATDALGGDGSEPVAGSVSGGSAGGSGKGGGGKGGGVNGGGASGSGGSAGTAGVSG